MAEELPIELFVPSQPGLIEEVEHACTIAASHPGGVTALAVDSSHVSRAADLLFGTGVGIVSMLKPAPNDLVHRARLSLAAGATELAIPRLDLEATGLAALRFVAGSDVALTVDVTTPEATADLARAEQALTLGADFVSFNPWSNAVGSPNEVRNLAAVVSELNLGGIKLADSRDGPHASAMRSEWAQAAQNSRLCLPTSHASP